MNGHKRLERSLLGVRRTCRFQAASDQDFVMQTAVVAVVTGKLRAL